MQYLCLGGRERAGALALSCSLFCAGWHAVAQERTYSVSVDVGLVIVNATVTDSNGQFFTSLQQDHFAVFEDKVEQKITRFTMEDVPASIGLILDVSGSMEKQFAKAKYAAMAFLRALNPEDEFCLLTFADQPRVEQDFTRDVSKIQKRLELAHPVGATTLYDAVYLCLKQMKYGHHPRKAILLITDGEDTQSRYSFANLRQALKESDIQIYAVGIQKCSFFEVGCSILEHMTRLTGGNAYFLRSFSELQETCMKIAEELKSQYVLGYSSSNPTKDGRWRKIKVKLKVPKAALKSLSVRSKAGYFAPAGFPSHLSVPRRRID